MSHATENFHGDLIVDLPTDKTMPSHEEIRIIDAMFQKNKGIMEKIAIDAKDAIVLGILFAIMSAPPVTDFLTKFFPSMGSPYMSILIRSIIFMLLYYVLKNLYLVRK